MPEFEEKTEQATPRRREKAREKGQIARSRELISIAATAGVIGTFFFAGDFFMTRMSVLTGNLLSLRYGRDPFAVMRAASSEMLLTLMPFFGMTVTFVLLAGVLQGGFLFKPLDIDLERLNPVNGLKRIFSLSGPLDFLKNLFKFVVGGVLFYFVIKGAIARVIPLSAMDLSQLQATAGKLLGKTVLSAFAVFFLLAAVDYLYQRWQFERSIKMTKEEIRDEFKESEGNPLVKSRIKTLQKAIARRRMMQEVPKATVVITNPTHLAVALRYEKNVSSTPRVTAKGAGFIAERIKEIAKEHAIPMVEDKPLTRTLYKLKIDSVIPEELYRAVAKILTHIYTLRGAAR
ncbi:MAG TPA: flagellar biosynthesis protein FlhB [Nitrospiraceae bacterium]|jgi:flagellar biosynthetic protein FlhB|nr:flagellar biosynthesis protein FlhB [Nitrospiraceae bacterium]